MSGIMVSVGTGMLRIIATINIYYLFIYVFIYLLIYVQEYQCFHVVVWPEVLVLFSFFILPRRVGLGGLG